MSLSVTSWFVDQCREKAPTVKRQFTIAGSDYSQFVTRWPQITRQWDDTRPLTCQVQVANEDQSFNFIRENTLNLRANCVVKIGFTHPTSGDELVTLFAGSVDKINYQQARADITLVDKMRQLSDRLIGTSDVPVTWTNSGTLPSDIAWWAAVSYGGFSSVASTSNPDIDYQSWLDWAAVFSRDNAQMFGRAEGQKCTEILRKIARHTISAIYMQGEKLTFQRFTAASSIVASVSNTELKDLRTTIDDQDMINKQYVFGNFNTTSRAWGFTVFDVNTASVNSYGLREQVEKDESVWYISSAAALNYAQRVIDTIKTPFERVQAEMPLLTLYMTIGDTLTVVEPQINLSGSYRIMQHGCNVDNGVMRSQIDRSQLKDPFTLDVSSLDGGDVLL